MVYKKVSYPLYNTDSKSLSANAVPTKILLGKTGLGAGADPEKGRQDAESNNLLFLNHPEGIEFKRLIEYKEELTDLYRKIGSRSSDEVIEKSIARLVNPLDNSVNEKCARIKSTFALCMNQYQLSYYAISSHTIRHIDGSSRTWFERKKTITLPRELVKME